MKITIDKLEQQKIKIAFQSEQNAAQRKQTADQMLAVAQQNSNNIIDMIVNRYGVDAKKIDRTKPCKIEDDQLIIADKVASAKEIVEAQNTKQTEARAKKKK